MTTYHSSLPRNWKPAADLDVLLTRPATAAELAEIKLVYASLARRRKQIRDGVRRHRGDVDARLKQLETNITLPERNITGNIMAELDKRRMH
jgi:porphobilinogen deaminase